MRTGDEASHARSPLRLRAALAAMGAVTGGAAAWWCRAHDLDAAALAFAVVAAVAVVDVLVVVHRIRSGAHWQPGPAVPAFRPAPAPLPDAVRIPPSPEVRAAEAEADLRRRMRRYLAVMGTCVVLLVNAWTWVRAVAPPVAVGMTLVAMVMPPIAAMLASPLRRR